MREAKMQSFIQELLEPAGITLNGDQPCDPQIHNAETYGRILHQGSLGLGEAYMDGWWDCERLDDFFYRVLRHGVQNRVPLNWKQMLFYLSNVVVNPQSPKRAYEVGRRHYDIGNDLYQAMLDASMNYSCGYWREADDLETAQRHKMDLICRKLQLEAGQTLLDIGCGWGGLLRYAAEQYGVRGVGVTISEQQADWAREHGEGWPIEIVMDDYRHIEGEFDRVVSVGMFEHVGYKNYETFMETVQRCIKQDGLFLLHTIGSNHSSRCTDPWLGTYIFPNSMLPSMRQIDEAAEDRFVMEDWHNFGADYDHTLMAWYANFEHHWPELKQKYDERFYRMWRYYLHCCAGGFRARHIQLWQIVFSPRGLEGGYRSVR